MPMLRKFYEAISWNKHRYYPTRGGTWNVCKTLWKVSLVKRTTMLFERIYKTYKFYGKYSGASGLRWNIQDFAN
jgi:hypothetical protein